MEDDDTKLCTLYCIKCGKTKFKFSWNLVKGKKAYFECEKCGAATLIYSGGDDILITKDVVSKINGRAYVSN